MSPQNNADSTLQTITELRVSGYKSIIQPQSIEIRPLTILAGTNSSGKSSVIQPALLLKQTLEAGFDPGPLLLEGPNVTFTSADQFFSRTGDDKARSTFDVGVTAAPDSSVDLSFTRHSEKGLQVSEMKFSDGEFTGALRPEMTDKELEALVKARFRGVWEHFLQLVLSSRDPAAQKGAVALKVGRERCFLVIQEADRSAPIGRSLGIPSLDFARRISRLIHLPGLRGNPERTYVVSGLGPTFPGTFEKYVASILVHWQEEKDPRLDELNRSLESLSLTWKITARPVTETRVELRVGRLPHGKRGGAHDLVSIADVGFGVSQTLPVLVALLVAEPGQVVYLEQPEIHLHPKAQSEMAKLLAEAATRGVRVIVETHSSLLLRSVQTVVAKGKLPAEIVKLHWFSRRPDGSTNVHSADLDSEGAFGDWPEDFDEVMLEAEKRYLDAAELAHRS